MFHRKSERESDRNGRKEDINATWVGEIRAIKKKIQPFSRQIFFAAFNFRLLLGTIEENTPCTAWLNVVHGHRQINSLFDQTERERVLFFFYVFNIFKFIILFLSSSRSKTNVEGWACLKTISVCSFRSGERAELLIVITSRDIPLLVRKQRREKSARRREWREVMRPLKIFC